MCECGSNRTLKIGGKVADMGNWRYTDDEGSLSGDGYMPDFGEMCSGDYIHVTICAECGKVQAHDMFPLTRERVKEIGEENGDLNEDE